MSQYVECDVLQLCSLGSFHYRTTLLARSPRLTVAMDGHERVCGRACAMGPDEGGRFGGQDYVSSSAGLTLTDRHCSGVNVEVRNLEPRQLTIAASGFERRSNQWTKFWIGSVD